MQLGAFSISLTVKDLAASRAFYEKLGFEVTGGDGEGYLILVNELTIIGLFQGMFEKNILTFNPGIAQQNPSLEGKLEAFTDVREIQQVLRERGIEPVTSTDPDGTGPGSIVVQDPDGNPILVDQHFPKPGAGPE